MSNANNDKQVSQNGSSDKDNAYFAPEAELSFGESLKVSLDQQAEFVTLSQELNHPNAHFLYLGPITEEHFWTNIIGLGLHDLATSNHDAYLAQAVSGGVSAHEMWHGLPGSYRAGIRRVVEAHRATADEHFRELTRGRLDIDIRALCPDGDYRSDHPAFSVAGFKPVILSAHLDSVGGFAADYHRPEDLRLSDGTPSFSLTDDVSSPHKVKIDTLVENLIAGSSELPDGIGAIYITDLMEATSFACLRLVKSGVRVTVAAAQVQELATAMLEKVKARLNEVG